MKMKWRNGELISSEMAMKSAESVKANGKIKSVMRNEIRKYRKSMKEISMCRREMCNINRNIYCIMRNAENVIMAINHCGYKCK
jgi:hypothetical protein